MAAVADVEMEEAPSVVVHFSGAQVAAEKMLELGLTPKKVRELREEKSQLLMQLSTAKFGRDQYSQMARTELDKLQAKSDLLQRECTRTLERLVAVEKLNHDMKLRLCGSENCKEQIKTLERELLTAKQALERHPPPKCSGCRSNILPGRELMSPCGHRICQTCWNVTKNRMARERKRTTECPQCSCPVSPRTIVKLFN